MVRFDLILHQNHCGLLLVKKYGISLHLRTRIQVRIRSLITYHLTHLTISLISLTLFLCITYLTISYTHHKEVRRSSFVVLEGSHGGVQKDTSFGSADRLLSRLNVWVSWNVHRDTTDVATIDKSTLLLNQNQTFNV